MAREQHALSSLCCCAMYLSNPHGLELHFGCKELSHSHGKGMVYLFKHINLIFRGIAEVLIVAPKVMLLLGSLSKHDA